MSKKISYKEALKKYGAEGVLELYLHSKINLTKKEWDDVHKRINKSYFSVNTKLSEKYSKLICIVIIIATAFISMGGYMDEMTKCKGVLEHECNNYEIAKINK